MNILIRSGLTGIDPEINKCTNNTCKTYLYNTCDMTPNQCPFPHTFLADLDSQHTSPGTLRGKCFQNNLTWWILWLLLEYKFDREELKLTPSCMAEGFENVLSNHEMDNIILELDLHFIE